MYQDDQEKEAVKIRKNNIKQDSQSMDEKTILFQILVGKAKNAPWIGFLL